MNNGAQYTLRMHTKNGGEYGIEVFATADKLARDIFEDQVMETREMGDTSITKVELFRGETKLAAEII